jgi:hypothetical protein
MRWIKANSQTPKKDVAEKKKGGKASRNNSKNVQGESAESSVRTNRTVIVFNPLLWREEIVNLIED